MERMHSTPSGIEDFASSRRHIDNLSLWTMFQLFHSTLLESDPAARGRSLFEKKKKKKKRKKKRKEKTEEKQTPRTEAQHALGEPSVGRALHPGPGANLGCLRQ